MAVPPRSPKGGVGNMSVEEVRNFPGALRTQIAMKHVHQKMQGGESEGVGSRKRGERTAGDQLCHASVPELRLPGDRDGFHPLVPKLEVQFDRDRETRGVVVSAPFPFGGAKHRRTM